MSSSVISASNAFVLFVPPTDETVDNSRGGASRPTALKCIHDDAYAFPMVALIPQSGVGLTVAAHPTLLVYVPPSKATQAHLTLRNADQSGLYQGRIQLPKTGGVLRIALPTDSPELAVGETYDWSLALLCQPTQTDMPIASGQIRRVELSDNVLSDQQSLLSKAIIYGQSGVWHDMLATLAMLRQTQPDNNALYANWTEVLTVEDLDAIANAPLLN
ncbi:DUF928 domain-containing protein [Leptothoe spongobia]|uniref:DUF928 domain-containing protein n=1 Tax=Leptothoe spongobia TAU-MAC 1115 TaxID=1967444 RepID=A0A947GIA8_9CYAN|nr:DUF928 domain-containing protein [Leptothoe spongobia]MBT9316000.1 DUF928 domain-containing protein [Leptothoe spongobia TAU-MAC 1115]